MSDHIPAQFTGVSASGPQDPKAFDLKPHSYTPREFTEEDVIIKVICCGLCGSDIHAFVPADGKSGMFPSITGHEIVGKVVKAGARSGRTVGQRVGFGGLCGSCRQCQMCENGLENYCKQQVISQQHPLESEVQPYTQGGMSDYFIGQGYCAVPIPDEIDSVTAAPLFCAGVTVFTPMKHYKVGPGTKVGVIGIGGLGHLALQFAKALGADVYAISSSESKREDAKKLGASHYISTADKDAVLKDYEAFFDVLICTSFQSGMPLKELYLPMIKPPLGRIVVLGIPDEGYPKLGLFDLLGKSFGGSMIGSPSDLEDMLALAAKHGIRTWAEERPMKEANKAFEDMRAGKNRYRYVLVN